MSELKGSNEAQEQQDMHRLIQVYLGELDELKTAGKDPLEIITYEQSHHTAEVKAHFDGLKGTEVSAAGRMMSKRTMGKTSLCMIRDLGGGIQIYVVCSAVGKEACAQFKKYNIGDTISVRGKVFEAKTGEISIRMGELTLLVKSMQPFPEKLHGLTDTDQHHRQRCIDPVMNSKVHETFVKRSKTISSIRRYLDNRGLIEVETPISISNAGGMAARSFETHYDVLSEDVRLRISLEFYLKCSIVGGLERVYEIGRVFRNEGLDARHNPGFTLMELYQAYTDYEGMMNPVEGVFHHVAREIDGNTKVIYNGTKTDLEKPFCRIMMTEAVKECSGADFVTIETLEGAKAVAKEKSAAFEERYQRDNILNLLFETFCEEHMTQPIFAADHLIEILPLTKKKPNNPDYVERFELFIYGREMCNVYSELNDPADQRERFKTQGALAAANDEKINHTNEDFLSALSVGILPTGNIGYGTDRLMMLLTDSPAICGALLPPTMETMKAGSKEAHDESGGKTEETSDFFTPNEKIGSNGIKIEPLLRDQVDFEAFSRGGFRVVKIRGCKAVPKSKKPLQLTLDGGAGTEHTILSGIHVYYEPEELIEETLIAITNLPPRPTMGVESCGMSLPAVNERNEEEEFYLLIVDNHIPTGAKLY